MFVTSTCPNCNARLAADHLVGDRGYCKGCGREYHVELRLSPYDYVPVWESSTSTPFLMEKMLAAVEKAPAAPPQPAPSETPPEQPAVGPEQGMTWREAAERLERLRSQGEPWTSQHEMARRFGCSSATINKAIRSTSELTVWAKRPDAAPKAQSVNDVVTDRTPQSREPDPADEVAIREYLERDDLTREERAFFNSLSRDDQLDFLDDPDKHTRILGRKP
jgi:hypothetical protein